MNGLIGCSLLGKVKVSTTYRRGDTLTLVTVTFIIPAIIAVTKYNPAERNHYAKVKGDSTVNHRPYLGTTMDLKCYYSLGDCHSPLPSPWDESPGWGSVGDIGELN